MSESRAKKINLRSGIGVVFRNIPITPKIITLTVLMSFALWLVLDNVQGPYIKKVFDNFLIKHLNEMAMETRVRFDNHVGLYNQAARLVVSQKNFYDYVSNGNGVHYGKSGVKHYQELPPWLPDASVMRKFVHVRYAFLIDSAGNVREVYNGWQGAVPDALLKPSDMLKQLSHNQSFMTLVEGMPFLLTSEFVKDKTGRILAGIMIANPLNDDFLTASQGGAGGANITALVTIENPRIIASNRPDILPEGAAFKDIEKDYVITGKSFFDWGASDLTLQLMSFMPKKEFDEMSKSIIAVNRLIRLIMTVILVACFIVINYQFTRHISSLTERIVGFSKYAFGIEHAAPPKGDEILILEDQFRSFMGEIIESRERLKKQAEEMLRLKNQQLEEALANVKTLSGLLPICASCKKIRDDKGYWNQIENYISTRSEAEFSHSICPECIKKLYPDYYVDMQKKKKEEEV